MSNFWDKLTFCFRTVFLGEHFFRGWKRCWEYWRLGEQKWRKALKPHIVANIHRMALEKLKETDKEGRQVQQASAFNIFYLFDFIRERKILGWLNFLLNRFLY
jgi:hypothetical protein